MYNIAPVLVTIFTLALVSSTSLWAAYNDKGIRHVRHQSDKMNQKIINSSELTKQQIIQLINRVNENDVRILQQHKDIKQEVKKTVQDTKSMNEDIDARVRGFKNITNANIVGMTDGLQTNYNVMNRRVDDLTGNFSDYRIKNDIKINESKFNNSNLSEMNSQLTSDLNSFKATTVSGLQSNNDYASDLNKNTVKFIDTKFNSFIGSSVNMDDKATAVLNNIRELTDKKLVSVESDFKRQDANIRSTITNMENTFKSQYMRSDEFEKQLNKTYFADKPDFDNLNSLIATTSQNKNGIFGAEKRMDANDLKLTSISNEYLKKSDVPQQINKAMPSTDIYKDFKNQEDELQRISKRITTNVDTIDKNNKELKEMLKSITGLDGSISLNDLQDRITKNAIAIERNTTKTKLEILQQIKANNQDIDKKIVENKIQIDAKISNEKDPYNKAFVELMDSANLSMKLKNSELEVNAMSAENVTIGQELMVQGVKFSSVMNDLKRTGIIGDSGVKPVTFPVYSRDFKSLDKIVPNKSMRFEPKTDLEMKDNVFRMDGTQLELQNALVNANDTDISWRKADNSVTLNGSGVNFNDTKIQVNTFDNLKNSRDETLSKFVDNRIEETQNASEGGLSQKVRQIVKDSPAGFEAKSLMTPYLYIGNPNEKINVKSEIDSIKQSITNFRAESGARQNAVFYSKQDPDDLHKEIRRDMIDNYDKYVPENALFKKITTDILEVEKINLKADSINNINFNGTSLSDALDKRYELNGTSAIAEGKSKKSVSNVQVDADANHLIVSFLDPDVPPAKVKLPSTPLSLQTVTIDKNELVLHYTNGRKQSLLLDLDSYARKEAVDQMYARKSLEDGSKVVHLSEDSKSRLDAIVSDDTIQKLKDFDPQTRVATHETELTGVKSRLKTMEKKSVGWDMGAVQIKSQINLATINEYTKANKTDNFIRLNDNVALRATGNRLQMCRNLDGKEGPSDAAYDADANCVDMWTTLDIKPDDNIKIQ